MQSADILRESVINMDTVKEKTQKSSKTGGAFLPIFLCWFAYTAAYLGRYSYSSNITAIEDAFGVTHSQSGLVTTCFFFAYGIGQVLNGILCKHYNKRVIISFVLLASSAINITIFFGVPFEYLKYLWLLNGVAQSVLWSSLIFVLSESLESQNLTKAVLAMSTTVTVGTFTVYGFSSLMSLVGNYTYTFLFAATVMIIASLCWALAYKKAFKGIKNKENANKSIQSYQKADFSLIIMIVMLCLLAVANNLVKDGLTTWVPSILKEQFGLPEALSILLTLILPIVGIFGAVANAALKKRISSFLTVGGIWYFISAVCLAFVILFLKLNVWYLVLFFFGVVALSMYGTNNLITGMAPLYMRDRINSGLLAGIINGCCYLGSTVSSYGLGSIADKFGWLGVFILLLCVAVFAVIISLLGFLNKSANSRND